MLERLLSTLPALGSLFFLAQDARLLVESPATHLGKHAILLHFFVEPPQRALKGLVLFNDNLRHILPSPLASQ